MQCLDAKQMVEVVGKLLASEGFASIAEFAIPNGKRFDLFGIDPVGTIIGIEIKVSEADMRGDFKWPDYLEHCDLFYLATAPQVDLKHAWPNVGRIAVENGVAKFTVEPVWRRMNEGRRYAAYLNFARVAAQRMREIVKEQLHGTD